MRFRIDLKILIFLVLFFITRQLELYLVIMAFAFIHECAHMIVGNLLGFKIHTLELMPFGFFTDMEANIEEYNTKIGKSNLVEFKKIFIVIAGPLTNLFLIGILVILNSFYGIEKLNMLVYSNFLIFLFNILPIFPLDGGRILKSILKIWIGYKKANKIVKAISRITVCMLTAMSSILILYFKNIAILLILIYIWVIF